MSLTKSELYNFINASNVSGESAYDIWKFLNPNGTEQEFIESLRGKSALEFWLQLECNQGKTEEDFYNWLATDNSELIAKEISDREAAIIQVLMDAKAYSDGKLAEETAAREAANTQLLVDSKEYTDQLVLIEKTERETSITDTLLEAKSYTDTQITESLKSNYDLWLEIGYEGTPKDFIEYLRGDSAYEVWLRQEGNEGKTEEEYFNSLKVISSNYDLWLSLGNEGTAEDFLNFLKGKTAYEVWLDQEGNAGKSEQDFFASLGFSDEQKSTLVNEVNSYTDQKIAEAVENLNDTGDTNLQAAKAYADEKVASEAFARETADTTTLNIAKEYTDNALANFTGAETVVGNHNVATDAHNDIRELIAGLTTRLNALADSDDTTLDQLSEIVAYIKANKGLIDGITTSKVSVDAIIDNLTTNDNTKVLSATQGVVLKGLIDTLTEALADKASTEYVDTKLSESIKHSEAQELTDEQKNTARTNISMAETEGVKFNHVIINYFMMKDTVTGTDYFVSIENGVIVYHPKLDHIEVTNIPNSMLFYEDDKLEDRGTEITAVYQDGSTEVISNYTYTLIPGNTSIEISYISMGETYTTTLEGATIKSLAEFVDCLIDFEYTDNGDGTYTITDWKGTYNGVASNRIMIPNSERIKL